MDKFSRHAEYHILGEIHDCAPPALLDLWRLPHPNDMQPLSDDRTDMELKADMLTVDGNLCTIRNMLCYNDDFYNGWELSISLKRASDPTAYKEYNAVIDGVFRGGWHIQRMPHEHTILVVSGTSLCAALKRHRDTWLEDTLPERLTRTPYWRSCPATDTSGGVASRWVYLDELGLKENEDYWLIEI